MLASDPARRPWGTRQGTLGRNRGTLGKLLAGRGAVVSVRREKSLDNPAGRVLAAACRVLRRRTGPGTEAG